jgi:uncharacterized protein with PIN domain
MEYPDHMFLVDRMLGRLVAWLRIFGYDTNSALDLKMSSNEDTLLIEMAKAEGRILLSRDKELVDRAKKAGVKAVLISPDDVREQLEVLMREYSLRIEPEMTRCTVCNACLRRATSEDLAMIENNDEIPEHLKEDYTRLWVCERCGKVYWQGSHWRNILKTADEVKNNKNENKKAV